MPISDDRAELYPDDWDDIAFEAKYRARWRCEACRVLVEPAAVRGRRHEVTTLSLTVHHFDDDPTNNEPWNLCVLCNRCHLTIEAGKWDPFAAQTLDMFPDDELRKVDPLAYWFREQRKHYRASHPDGGIHRPRPRSTRNTPRRERVDADGQQKLFDDEATA